MNFTTGLVRKAELWLGCKELTTVGASPCLNEITEYFNGKLTNEHWCAKFMWVVVDQTAKDFGLKTQLPKTASTSTMVSQAPKKGLRVDTVPAPGSIFYRTREGGGHVGLIIEVRNGTIKTIEGNTSNSVAYRTHSKLSGYRFIHTEEMPRLQGKPDSGSISLNKPGFLYDFYAGLEDSTVAVAGGVLVASTLAAGAYLLRKI